MDGDLLTLFLASSGCLDSPPDWPRPQPLARHIRLLSGVLPTYMANVMPVPAKSSRRRPNWSSASAFIG